MAWVNEVGAVTLPNNVYCWSDMQAERISNSQVRIDVITYMRPNVGISTGIGGFLMNDQFMCGTINSWNPPSNAGWKPAGTVYPGQYRDGSTQRSFYIDTIDDNYNVVVVWYAGANINIDTTYNIKFPPGYVPLNPDISIAVSSNTVNNVTAEYTSSDFTDQVSYSYNYRLFSDSGRTNQVFTYTGTDINQFPIIWNQATPGTTYYWQLDCRSTDIQGNDRYMPTKYGSVRTMNAFVNIKNFTYTASPTPNGHFTPRTVISYTISNTGANDMSQGLNFYTFEFETSLNALNANVKSFRNSSYTGTVSLVDLNKMLREAKPRDLFYMKVRVVARDSLSREYFSNWFGITTGQAIYNWFQLYLTRNTTAEQLRINSRFQNAGTSNEKYWNKGQVT